MKPKQIVEKLENSVATFSWQEKGILKVHFKANSIISPKEQDEMMSTQIEFTGGEPHCILYTADEFVNFTPEARKRTKELEHKINYLASASISHNIAYMIIANFYIKFNKPQKPFRNFKKQEEALHWLRGFLK